MSGNGPIKSRPTNELILLILAVSLGILLVISLIMIGLIEMFNPTVDTESAITMITATTTVLIGVVVGYVSGRRASNGRDREE